MNPTRSKMFALSRSSSMPVPSLVVQAQLYQCKSPVVIREAVPESDQMTTVWSREESA